MNIGDTGSRGTLGPRFASAGNRFAVTTSGPTDRHAEISAKRDRVIERAKDHFEKHRKVWTNRQYATLLRREGERMTMKPPGVVDDRKAHLMRAADHVIRQRQAKRLARIDKAAERMNGNGREMKMSDNLSR